jgi:hypothetical protein
MQSADRGRQAGDAGERRISAESAGRVPRLGAPHGTIIATNQDSIYGRLTDDIVDNVDNVKTAHLRSDAPTTSRRDNVSIVNIVRVSKTSLSPLTSAFSAIERQCSDLVSVADWQRAVGDGRRSSVGRTTVRLSRYDVIGLIWLLHGRPVVALTANRAVIGTAGGGVTFYRMATQNH